MLWNWSQIRPSYTEWGWHANTNHESKITQNQATFCRSVVSQLCMNLWWISSNIYSCLQILSKRHINMNAFWYRMFRCMVVYVVKLFRKLKKRHENSGSDVTQFSWQRIPTQISEDMYFKIVDSQSATRVPLVDLAGWCPLTWQNHPCSLGGNSCVLPQWNIILMFQKEKRQSLSDFFFIRIHKILSIYIFGCWQIQKDLRKFRD